jgi:hypothetical protein
MVIHLSNPGYTGGRDRRIMVQVSLVKKKCKTLAKGKGGY